MLPEFSSDILPHALHSLFLLPQGLGEHLQRRTSHQNLVTSTLRLLWQTLARELLMAAVGPMLLEEWWS